MKMLRPVLIAAICMLAIGARAHADTAPTLTLDPANGAVAGPAGSAVGWGFTLTAGSSDFSVITGSDFCVGVVTSPCSNTFGTYTDFAGAQYLVVGSGLGESPITEAFDDAMMTGMGSFAVNPGSTGTLSGFIAVTYDLFSVDPNSPNFDPTVDTVSTGNYLETDASVTVGSSTTPVPEPGFFGSLLAGLAAAVVLAGLRSQRDAKFRS
jgi:hypothetical protein